jgi:hypothetical protein
MPRPDIDGGKPKSTGSNPLWARMQGAIPASPFRSARPPSAADNAGASSEPPASRKVKTRFLSFGERVRGAFRSEPPYRSSRPEPTPLRSNPILIMLAAFVGWSIIRMIGFAPLMILMKILAFLMSWPGLIVVLIGAYFYSQHRERVDAAIAMQRRRVFGFYRAANEAIRSVSWLTDRIAFLRGMVKPPPSKPPAGTRGPVSGATVRVLEDDADVDPDDEEEP